MKNINCLNCGKSLTYEEKEMKFCYECYYSKGITKKEDITRTCTNCGETKKISEFHLDPSIWNGYKKQCKECYNAKKRARYRLDKERKNQTTEQKLQWRIKETENKQEKSRLIKELHTLQKEKRKHQWRKKVKWFPSIGKYYRYTDLDTGKIEIFKVIDVKVKKDKRMLTVEMIKPYNGEIHHITETQSRLCNFRRIHEITKDEAFNNQK